MEFCFAKQIGSIEQFGLAKVLGPTQQIASQ